MSPTAPPPDVLHVVTAGGLQPVRARLLHDRVPGLLTLAPPAIRQRHGLTFAVPASLADVAACIRARPWRKIVVQKWAFGHADLPLGHGWRYAFADALEHAHRVHGTERILIRRIVDPRVAPANDRAARLYDTVVDGEGHWTAGAVAWAGDAPASTVACPADLDHGLRPSGPLVLVGDLLDGEHPRPERALCAWSGVPAELAAHGIPFDGVPLTREQMARSEQPIADYSSLDAAVQAST